MKRVISFFTLLCFSLFSLQAQSLPKLAVLSLDVLGFKADPLALGGVVRTQIIKAGGYDVIDRYDLLEILASDSQAWKGCYSRSCLMELGNKVKADKFITGSVEAIGDKMSVTLRMLDVQTGSFEKAVVGEYLYDPNEVERMITLTLNDLLGKAKDPDLVRNLEYYSVLRNPVSTRIINNGPRVGVGVFVGDVARRISAPEAQGGLNSYPIMSQMGYQHEIMYLNSGNFQALIENLWMISGLEQSLFIPSWIIMNGFRDAKSGMEFGFGPSFAVRTVADGYFDGEGTWIRTFGETNIFGDPIPADAVVTSQLDTRGNVELYTRFVFTVGKTFRSGYLNVPVNLYVSPRKGDWLMGAAMGFNLQKQRERKGVRR